MHVGNNICDVLLETLLDNKGKTEEIVNVRSELIRMKTGKELHPIFKGDNRYELPPACYTLTSSERNRFLDVLKHFKVLDGYAFCWIAVKDSKICRLSHVNHDFQLLMQQLLLIPVRVSC